MIYGEEVKTLDISRGLWLTDDLDAVPDGYCANLVNLVATPTGGWEVRPNFIEAANVGQPTLATSAVGTQAESTDYYFTHDLSKAMTSWDLQAVETYHPLILVGTYNSSTLAAVFHFLCKDGTFGNASLAGVGGVPTSIAQYRNRHYVTEFGSSTIFRYDFTVGYSITRTTIQVLPALGSISQIISFRDRIFAFSQRESRVFYSDLATTGGYPESWNSGNNFFDLPDSGAVVREAFVHNDRLYMFTNVGVYQLYASGNPGSWVVMPVTKNIQIQSKGHVALIGESFIYTDMRSVFSYNGGSSIVEIGTPIKASFRAKVNDYALPIEGSVQTYNGPSSANIYPFQNGFILAQHFMSGNPTLARVRVSKYYYYDGSVWSEIQFDSDSTGLNRDHYQLIGTMQRKPAKASTQINKVFDDVIVEARYNASATSLVLKTKTVRLDNTYVNSAIVTNIGLFTKDLNLGEPKVTRIKEFNVRSRTSLADFIVSPYIDGTFSNTVTLANAIAGARLFRGTVETQRGNSIAFSLFAEFSFDATVGSQSLYSYPSFRLNSFNVICNTDTRRAPNQETIT